MKKEFVQHPEGTFKASVIDYGTDTVNDKNVVYMLFKTEAGIIKYTGYLTQAAVEYTMNNLVTAGCTDLGGVADGPQSKAFAEKEVSIVVKHEADQKDASKKYARVKFINELSKPKDAAVVAAGKSALSEFAAQFQLAKQKSGSTTATQTLPQVKGW